APLSLATPTFRRPGCRQIRHPLEAPSGRTASSPHQLRPPEEVALSSTGDIAQPDQLTVGQRTQPSVDAPATSPAVTIPAVAVHPRQPSTSVTGVFPRRRWLVVLLSALGGFLLTYLWSAKLVDKTIGFNVADGILGRDAHDTPIGGIASGVLFAFVTGLAG